MAARRFLVLQGPNLDRLGRREPETYGAQSLDELSASLDELAATLGVELEHAQSSHEGVLVERVHRAIDDGIEAAIVNAAAYTHTSIALRDALLSGPLPFIEVHLSNVHARERFRHHSVLADVAIGVITGLGPQSYALALRALVGSGSVG